MKKEMNSNRVEYHHNVIIDLLKRETLTDLFYEMTYLCRGLLPTNKIGFPKLMSEYGYMHRLFAIGHVGSMQLLLRGYSTLSWADTDFRNNIKVNSHICVICRKSK